MQIVSGPPARNLEIAPVKGRFLPGETLVVRNAEIGGGENAADMERPLSTPRSHLEEAE
jgi:hypothetical protein